LLVASARAATAQWADERARPHCPAVDTQSTEFACPPAGPGFSLFANVDYAGTGFRMKGNFQFATTNEGPCERASNLSGSGGAARCMYIFKPGRGWVFNWFQLGLLAGVPPSEWRKIRDVAPSAANATGAGWAVMWGNLIGGLIMENGPADGTLGKLFSGVQSTADGSCLDNTDFARNGQMPAGIPVLATSDCPPSWPAGGFDGPTAIGPEGWLAHRTQAGGGFTWEYWRAPSRFRSGFPLGTFSTYGLISDHYKEQRTRFGAVLPGGVGAPQIEGYPLGLDWRFDAWKYDLPHLASTVFYRLTIVNRTADVWGTGINYDSLFLGLSTASAGSPDNQGHYYEPARSRVIYHQPGVNPNCNDAPVVTGATQGCTTGTDAGYGRGATGILVLKSPIGDLRNKQFTDPTSPFYDPSHPHAGDTITFNHGHLCGFGGCTQAVWNVSDKRSFGFMASIEGLVLDGRNPAIIQSREYWRVFRSADFPAQTGRFNKYVPGVQGPPAATWDWNKDGVPDTLYLDTCAEDGCVVTDADTMPSGHVNGYSNMGGVLGVGPIKLAAGDTTSFWIAIVGQSDSLPLFREMDAAEATYQKLFLGPQAPPPPSILTTAVRAATTAGSGGLLRADQPSVTLYLGEQAERWEDPFLLDFAADMATADPGTPLGDLRDLNAREQRLIVRIDTVSVSPLVTDTTYQIVPGRDLVAEVRAAARNNVERIEIYKSCDGGATFTADTNCKGDPARDTRGRPVGSGWQAYRTFERIVPGGDLPNVFTDDAVLAGRSYLYAVVAVSRGVALTVVSPRSSQDTLVLAPPLANPLSTAVTDAHVVSVYVPVGEQAGARRGTFTLDSAGTVTVPLQASLTDSVIPGRYRAVFGSRFTVRTVRTGGAVEAWVEAADVVPAVDVSGRFVDLERRSATYRTTDPAGVPLTPEPTATVSGDTTTQVLTGVGFVLLNANEVPLFVTTALTGSAATPPAVFARGDFPGFTLSFDNRLGGRHVPDETLVTASGDTVPPENVDRYHVQWLETRAAPQGAGRGRYRITWLADPYGLTRPLTLFLANPAATQNELAAALAARTAGTVGLTDAEAAALLGVPQTDLVPRRFPFTIRNETFDREVRLAAVARPVDSLLLGSGSDTARVAIPATEWVPGDLLYFIETVTRDSLRSGMWVVLDAQGKPITLTRPEITLMAVLGCTDPPQCTPASATPPAPYVPIAAGAMSEFAYYNAATSGSLLTFSITPPVTGAAVTAITADDLARIRVVPNPFVVFSEYQTDFATARILFTGVPPSGTLRIYTVSGQFVQQIRWTAADLNATGDLAYNLRNSGDVDLASGLYLWVLTTDVGGTRQTARGKFVVIRGTVR